MVARTFSAEDGEAFRESMAMALLYCWMTKTSSSSSGSGPASGGVWRS